MREGRGGEEEGEGDTGYGEGEKGGGEGGGAEVVSAFRPNIAVGSISV